METNKSNQKESNSEIDFEDINFKLGTILNLIKKQNGRNEQSNTPNIRNK